MPVRTSPFMVLAVGAPTPARPGGWMREARAMPPQPTEPGAGRVAVPPRERHGPPAPHGPDHPADVDLVHRLRAGDDRAFAEIVDGWSPVMLRVARSHVSTDASAEEVVQEAWMALVKGLDRFEGRSSLRTWTFRILTNLAKTRGVREARSVPLSALEPGDPGASPVSPDRFRGADDPWPGHWTPVGSPRPWQPSPEESSLTGELRDHLSVSLTRLPDRQRAVVSLRDVHGLSSDEVCWALGISPTNQRVLLHRGRTRLRQELESYVHAVDRGEMP